MLCFTSQPHPAEVPLTHTHNILTTHARMPCAAGLTVRYAATPMLDRAKGAALPLPSKRVTVAFTTVPAVMGPVTANTQAYSHDCIARYQDIHLHMIACSLDPTGVNSSQAVHACQMPGQSPPPEHHGAHMPARVRNKTLWVVQAAPGLDTTATVSVSTTAPAFTFTVASRTVVLLRGMRQAPNKDMGCLLTTKGCCGKGGWGGWYPGAWWTRPIAACPTHDAQPHPHAHCNPSCNNHGEIGR